MTTRKRTSRKTERRHTREQRPERKSSGKSRKAKPASAESRRPLFISLTVIGFFVLSYFIFPPVEEGVKTVYNAVMKEDEEGLKEWISQFGIFGPVLIIVIMLGQMFTFFVPNPLVMAIAILSYGPFWGSILSLVGVFASSSLGYYIGYHLSPLTLQKFVSDESRKKISAFLKDYGAAAIVVTRLSSFSNDALGFVAGILRMGYKKYILCTMAGITPLVVVLAMYGHSGKIERALIWIAAASIIMFVAYVMIDERRKRRKNKK